MGEKERQFSKNMEDKEGQCRKNMEDRERYRLVFKQSRDKVKEWEENFLASNNRKPTREEIQAAPDKILVCYKNCKKIKLYFEKEHARRKEEEAASKDASRGEDASGDGGSSNSPTLPSAGSKAAVDGSSPENQGPRGALSFSGIFQKTGDEPDLGEIGVGGGACVDISNKPLPRVWGDHLNKRSRSATSDNPRLSSQLAGKLALSFQGKAAGTRTSLKKRSRLSEKSRSFLGSMGDDRIEDSGSSVLMPAGGGAEMSQSPLLLSDDTILAVEGIGVDESTTFHLNDGAGSGGVSAASGSRLELDDTSLSLDLFLQAGKARVVQPQPAVATSGGQHQRQRTTVDPSWLERCVEVEKSELPPVPAQLPATSQLSQMEDPAQVAQNVKQITPSSVEQKSTLSRGTSLKPTKALGAGQKSSKPQEEFTKSDGLNFVGLFQSKVESSSDSSSTRTCSNNSISDAHNSGKSVTQLSCRGKRKRVESVGEILSDGDEEVDCPPPSHHKGRTGEKSKKQKLMTKTSKLADNQHHPEEDINSELVDAKGASKQKGKAPRITNKRIPRVVATNTTRIRGRKRSEEVEINSDPEYEGESVDDPAAVNTGSVPAAEDGPAPMNIFALGFEETGNNDSGDRPSVKPSLGSRETRLLKKVATGKANENYVKINIKKRKFVRGRQGMSGEMAKRAEWKRKLALKEGTKVKEYKCFQCGELGHFSRQCTGGQGDKLIPQELADQFDAGEFPTLEQASQMARGGSATRHNQPATASSDHLNMEAEDEAILLAAAEQFEAIAAATEQESAEWQERLRVPALVAAPADNDNTAVNVKPAAEDATSCDDSRGQFAASGAVLSEPFDPALIRRTLQKFGHAQFRPGQEAAVNRILAGQSSLVLLATGSGKSLIYQLPAYLYAEQRQCITLVVSPLVSLMEDQVTGLPPFLRAAALHYNMTAKQREKVVEQVKSGRLHFLLVSPEAVAGGGGAFGSLLPFLPPIAFVCIDEAHCVSQWSHNFRPSYLRLCKVIREKLGVKTILGLTATAPERMIRSVADQLGVAEAGIIRGPLLPSNLTLTVSRDQERDAALLALLVEGGALGEAESVIVYCTRRDECERLATYIRTHLQERDYQLAERRERRVRVSATAEPYHAGMTPSRRRTVQAHFMSGKLRVVVATVAFGMGIDKADIRAIIHYNMPKAFESYIQEIGRAGRDGLPARCHLFLDTEGRDLNELKRHVFSNSMDRFTLRKLLNNIFPLGEGDSPEMPPGQQRDYKEVALSVNSLVEMLDLPEENISTLLCYLEAGSCGQRPWIKLSNPVYAHCKVQCYGGPLQLRSVASRCPPLAAAIAIQRLAGEDFSRASSVEFPVVDISARMGWSSAVVKKELKNLQWLSTPVGWKKSGVVVEFADLAFHFDALTGVSEGRLDALLEELFTRAKNQEQAELCNLYRLFQAFTLVSYKKHNDQTDELNVEKSDKLKTFIAEYFSEPDRLVAEVMETPSTCDNESDVRGDVRAFVSAHNDHTFNGRAVARIFHGIQSPNFPAKQWGRVPRYWRSHLHVDFNLLVRIASEEVLKLRTGR